MQRLILDARWSNRLFHPPPHSRLAVPAALSRLLAGVETERLDAAAGRAHPSYVAEPVDTPEVDIVAAQGWPVWGYSLDLTDGFYQFKSERMASLFGLGECMSVAEVEAFLVRRVWELHEDSTRSMVSTEPDEVVDAAFLGMPMGLEPALLQRGYQPRHAGVAPPGRIAAHLARRPAAGAILPSRLPRNGTIRRQPECAGGGPSVWAEGLQPAGRRAGEQRFRGPRPSGRKSTLRVLGDDPGGPSRR